MSVTYIVARSNSQFFDMPRQGRATAKLPAREVDRRKDWIEKATTKLAHDYDTIVIEDLKVKNMTKSAKGTLSNPGKNVRQKAGLNRSILSQGWGIFRRRLTDKATNATTPVTIVVINPVYTSQRCSKCGHTEKKNRKSQAVFSCQSCGHIDNADVNAAKNIHAAGLAVTGRRGILQAKSVSTKQSNPMKRQPLVSV